MKKLNNNGFSAVEVVLVIVVVGLIAGLGWYVMNNRETEKSEVSQNQQVEESPTVVENKGVIPEGYKKYTDTNYKFSFGYPDDWKVQTNTFPDENEYVAGADDTNEVEGDGGYSLRVFIGSKLADEVSKYKSDNKDFEYSEEAITKGGYRGTKLTWTVEQEDPAGTFRNSVYFFEVDEDVYLWSPVYEKETLNPEFVTESNNFLNSLKLL